MIDKDLIELQKGCKATCAIILEEDCKELDSKLVIDSNINNNELMEVLKQDFSKIDYLVISEIDKLNNLEQNKYYQIVKDKEIYGYEIPKDVIIILTVKNKDGLKKISDELYHLCVVAF